MGPSGPLFASRERRKRGPVDRFAPIAGTSKAKPKQDRLITRHHSTWRKDHDKLNICQDIFDSQGHLSILESFRCEQYAPTCVCTPLALFLCTRQVSLCSHAALHAVPIPDNGVVISCSCA